MFIGMKDVKIFIHKGEDWQHVSSEQILLRKKKEKDVKIFRR